MIRPTVPIHRGDDAARQGDDEHHRQRRSGKRERPGQCLGKFVDDGNLRRITHAHIPVHNPVQPVEILLVKGQV